MSHRAEKHACFQTFGTCSNLWLLVFSKVQSSCGNSQQPNECLELAPSDPVRSNKEAGLVPASWLPSSGPVPAGSSPAHRSSALPQKQCLTGPSQHQLCSTTWQFRLIFYGTFPPHVSISFFIQRRRYRYVYASIEHEVLHESGSTLVITSLPAVPFSHLCLLLPSKTHSTCALLTYRKSKFAEEQIDTVWLSSMLIY